jgi:hypothetical protein
MLSRLPRLPRLPLVLAASFAVLAGAGLVASHVAARLIESRLLDALGPRATLSTVSVGLASITVHDLRIAGQRGAWPVDDEVRAAELTVRPGLRSLWSAMRGGAFVIDEVTLRDGYVSALRTRDGRLHLVPALLERANEPGASAGAAPAARREPSPPPASAAARLVIETIRVEHVTLDLRDASLKTPSPHRLRFENVDARVGPLALPGLAQPVSLDLAATLKGVEHDGAITIRGTLTPATKDADLAARVKQVDLVALQPYLFQINDGGVRHGRLDLALDVHVEHQHLHAPGTVTLAGLELGSGGGSGGGAAFGSLGSGARQALIDLMSRDGRLTAKFALEGRLDDPAFSLNENLATRFASGVADSMGVGVQGVVQGMGHVLKGLVGR